MTVEVVRLREGAVHSACARECELHQVVETTFSGIIFVHTRIEQCCDTCCSARPQTSACFLHVSKPTITVLATSNITNCCVDGFFGNFQPCVARAPERHHFANRDRDVGIVGHGVVAPPTLIVLTIHDELHRAHKCIAHALIRVIHPVHFTEKQSCEPVSVHRSTRLITRDQSRLTAIRQHVVQRVLHSLAVSASTRNASFGHECNSTKCGDPRVLRESTLTKAAVLILRRL